MRYDLAWQRAGISYRQADHWRHMGYINATANGSGNAASEITVAEAHTLLRMATLVRAGMKAADASRVAHAAAEHSTVDLPGGIRITFDNQPAQQQEASTA